ncbi:uncharacterized protein P174DRAFT_437024 [Aspergillus novofumigatus IBT 16806]|uniref:Uncharacterized protein n=1 Tax=Aspergillus novofumigatus (strain IBT 16806) TaxID=1392255 RepID=A0A2I1CLW5_ASPN1|nr:uncharacterized protein P174DRAFT_437024 [Aspergillus novofumigatus IBT 16806]PKX98604.1 hypothetical protein P174DRAFT_437024 [Aspergillus novofumigatus IBT 16806]
MSIHRNAGDRIIEQDGQGCNYVSRLTHANTEDSPEYKHADADEEFCRKPSTFRSFVLSDSSSEYPAGKTVTCLYLGYGCSWGHRTGAHSQATRNHHPSWWRRTRKGGSSLAGSGPRRGSPYTGFMLLKELYLKADPQYDGRYTIPILWNKQRQPIVNNESSEIIHMFYADFDHPAQGGAQSRPARGGGLYPRLCEPTSTP